MLQRTRRARCEPGDKHPQLDVAGAPGRQMSANLDRDAELLGDLARQRLFGGLPRLHLAAGKLPLPCVSHLGSTLGHQATVMDDDGRAYDEHVSL